MVREALAAGTPSAPFEDYRFDQKYKKRIAELRAKREARRRRGHKKKKKKGGDDIDRAMHAAVVARLAQMQALEARVLAPRATVLTICHVGDMADDLTGRVISEERDALQAKADRAVKKRTGLLGGGGEGGGEGGGAGGEGGGGEQTDDEGSMMSHGPFGV